MTCNLLADGKGGGDHPRLASRSSYSPRTQEICDHLGYADCPACGVYSGKLHRLNAGLWSRRLARVARPELVDPYSGWSEAAIRDHLRAITTAVIGGGGDGKQRQQPATR